MEQHWYFCYTCGLTQSKGCCSTCAKICHKGHKVVYSRLSRFFCDCGAGGAPNNPCSCLHPRRYAPPSTCPPQAPSANRQADTESDSDTEDALESLAGPTGLGAAVHCSVSPETEKKAVAILKQGKVEEKVVALASRLLMSCGKQLEVTGASQKCQLSISGGDKVLVPSVDLVVLRKLFKPGTFDSRSKIEYPNGRELKAALATGNLVKSVLSSDSKGRIALAEGDKLSVFDGTLLAAGSSSNGPLTLEKGAVKPLSRNIVRFEVVKLAFCPANEGHLAVAGYQDLQVWTLNSGGEVVGRLQLELALLPGAFVKHIEWLPNSQVELLVATTAWVKVYDLSTDAVSPKHCFAVLEDTIVDSSLVPNAATGHLSALVLTQQGHLYTETLEGSSSGERLLTEQIQLPDKLADKRGRSLQFVSEANRLLILTSEDGYCLLGQLSADCTSLEANCLLLGDKSRPTRPPALHHWQTFKDTPGLFWCLLGQRHGGAAAVQLWGGVETQALRLGSSSSSLRADGVTAFAHSDGSTQVLVLLEDGSLLVFNTGGKEGGVSKTSAPAKALEKPKLPLDFFEKTVCVTPEVKYGGDVLLSSDAEAIKISLAAEEGFVEGPRVGPFKLSVYNSNSDLVMVGCRVHVGTTSVAHIPREIGLFGRALPLEEGIRRWYDVPFTAEEAATAAKEFTITIGPAYTSSVPPRIDACEVYARRKDEVNWKVESTVNAGASEEPAPEGCLSSWETSVAQEKPAVAALSCSLRLLQAAYSTSVPESGELSASTLALLENVFQAEQIPELEVVAKRVLRVLKPSPPAYHTSLDLLSLKAIASSLPSLTSEPTDSSAALATLTHHMRTVSKISTHRPSNLVSFLDSEGPSFAKLAQEAFWLLVNRSPIEHRHISTLVGGVVDLLWAYACSLLPEGAPLTPILEAVKKLLLAPQEAVRVAASLTMSSRLLNVPVVDLSPLGGRESQPESSKEESSSAWRGPPGPHEEEVAMASVQYCCDGCSLNPITRVRWHCNVCPDFDYCQSCYDAAYDGPPSDPPGHSRDHPMTAIRVDQIPPNSHPQPGSHFEEIGTDDGEPALEFEDALDEALLEFAREMSMQPVDHPVEPRGHDSEEEEEVPVRARTEIKPEVEGSRRPDRPEEAKYRKVRSALLSGLLDDLDWLQHCQGAEALPALQLLYRLAAAGEVFGLEHCCASLLRQLDLARPPSTTERTPKGEVAVLLFMFFVMVLRNWRHQSAEAEGGDLSPDTKETGASAWTAAESAGGDVSGAMDKARALLRQQALADYLLTVIQGLTDLTKKPRKDKSGEDRSRGGLLKVRKEVFPGSCAPFFSDTYARMHRGDLFIEYPRLLLESSFRLVCSMVKGASEKDSAGPTIKPEAWEDVLCRFILCPHTGYVRKYARRLLLQAHNNSKEAYYSARDHWQLTKEIKRLHKLQESSDTFRLPLSYDTSVKLVRCLTTLVEVASARPHNWQKFCSSGTILLSFLSAAPYVGDEALLRVLKLLALAFHCEDKTGGQEEKEHTPPPDMSVAVKLLTEGLQEFVDKLLLGANAKALREEAKKTVFGMWTHSYKQHQIQSVILDSLLVKLPTLAGQNLAECTTLLNQLLTDTKADADIIRTRLSATGAARSVLKALQVQTSVVMDHPHHKLYQVLGGMVELDGFYLENEPCLACNSPEVPYQRMKLESLKAETRYTDNRIVVKCNGSHLIQSVWMNVHDSRRSRSVRVLNMYYNNRPVTDATELKNNWSLWRRAKTCHLAPNQAELRVEFAVPIAACNFMIEFQAFHDNLQVGSVESLQCPRCSRYVTDKHGICSNCHENAYQCRQCRNINYENLDAFLCNECGYSKYGRFDFSFTAKPNFAFDAMENDEDMKRGLALIASESENAVKRSQQLAGLKRPLLKLLQSIAEPETELGMNTSTVQPVAALRGSDASTLFAPKVSHKVAILGVLYGDKCKGAFESLSKSVRTLLGARKALSDYLLRKHRAAGDEQAALPAVTFLQTSQCYGCANNYLTHCMEWLRLLASREESKGELLEAGALQVLLSANIHHGPRLARTRARSVLCLLVQGNPKATAELTDRISQKVKRCLEQAYTGLDLASTVKPDLSLLSDMCSLADNLWESRLRVALSLLFTAIRQGGSHHPSTADNIILPCLHIVAQMCTPPVDAKLADSAPQPEDQVSKSAALKVGLFHAPPLRSPPSPPLERRKEGKTEEGVVLGLDELSRGGMYKDLLEIEGILRRLNSNKPAKPQGGLTSATQAQKELRAQDLASRYWLRWQSKALKGSSQQLDPSQEDSYLQELLLCRASQALRSEACALVETLSAAQNGCSPRRLRFLDFLTALLPAARHAGSEAAADFIELYSKLVQGEEERLYLTARGWLKHACGMIKEEVLEIQAGEDTYYSAHVSHALMLQKLIELLSSFLQLPTVRRRFVAEGFVSVILESLVALRGLVVASSKASSDCSTQLRALLDTLLNENETNKRHFLRACVAALEASSSRAAAVHLLEQLCAVICPEQPEPVYLLSLQKAHTQEEFIRGSMTKNPYSSSEVGPLMRDVKNKICTQLEMPGLLEDDFGMELLVAGNIINLDLTIRQVYEKVWRPSAGATGKDCPPMVVIYRLQGLDGEATERMIDNLEDDRGTAMDPEVEFGITGEMATCGGLQLLLTRLRHCLAGSEGSQEELGLLLRLLRACCKVRSNRRALLQLGALHVLLERARLLVSSKSEDSEGLLEMVELLASEANETTPSDASQDTSDRSAEGVAAVRIFLEKLDLEGGAFEGEKLSRKQKERLSHANTVARILPFLTFGESAAMEELVGHFEECLEFAKLDKEGQQRLASFARVCEGIRLDEYGKRLRDLLAFKQVPSRAVSYLVEEFPPVSTGGEAAAQARSDPRWATAMQLPSLPAVLGILKGCAVAHPTTQRLLGESGVLGLLHAMEGASGEEGKAVRLKAEELLEAVADPAQKGTLGPQVADLRRATKEEARRRAMAKREEMLASLGMQRQKAADGAERIVLAKTKAPALEGLDDVDEETNDNEGTALACMVCREGYRLRPSEMLGAYCFCRRVNLGQLLSSTRVDWGYNTVSHFNLIHFSCHIEAKRADSALKVSKKEWDGAALRNSETLCNNLFPVRGPSVPSSAYERCLNMYWDNMAALGRAEGGRLRLMAYDLAAMLTRFATNSSFSAESKGGGKASNAQLVPFMVQQACYLLEQGGSSARRTWTRLLDSFLAESPSADPTTPSRLPPSPSPRSADEGVQLMLVMSLLLQSPKAWRQHRRTFLQRAMTFAYAQHKEGRPLLAPSQSPRVSPRPSSADVAGSAFVERGQVFTIVKPMVVYVALVDKLQGFFKSAVEATTPGKARQSLGDEDAEVAQWWAMMKMKVMNVGEMAAFGSEFVDFVEEMWGAMDAQEAFDTMGFLEDVIGGSGPGTTCESFVQQAVQPAMRAEHSR